MEKSVEVTLAVLDTKLDAVIERLDNISSDQETRLRELERNRTESKMRWKGHDKEHETLKMKIISIDVVAWAIAVVSSHFIK